MSTETNNPSDVPFEDIVKGSPFAEPITISRNGVDQTLEVFVGKRGAWENKPYAAVQIKTDPAKDLVTDEGFIAGLTFFGKDNIAKIVNVLARRSGQDFVEDAIGAEGTPSAGIFSMDAFKKSWENFAAAGLKIAELKELLEAEQKKHQDYIANDAMAIFMSPDASMEEKAAVKANIDARTASINALRHELEQRQQRRSKEAQTETTAAN